MLVVERPPKETVPAMGSSHMGPTITVAVETTIADRHRVAGAVT
jgi:hypothetical protein